MRALFVSIDKTFTPGDSVAEIHDHAVGEWRISPAEVSDAMLLVPVADGRPVGMQIVGRPRGEAALLSAGLVVEDILGLRDTVPIDPRTH